MGFFLTQSLASFPFLNSNIKYPLHQNIFISSTNFITSFKNSIPKEIPNVICFNVNKLLFLSTKPRKFEINFNKIILFHYGYRSFESRQQSYKNAVKIEYKSTAINHIDVRGNTGLIRWFKKNNSTNQG